MGYVLDFCPPHDQNRSAIIACSACYYLRGCDWKASSSSSSILTHVCKKGSLPTNHKAVTFFPPSATTYGKPNQAESLINNPKGPEILLNRTPDSIFQSDWTCWIKWCFVQSRVPLNRTLMLFSRSSSHVNRLGRCPSLSHASLAQLGCAISVQIFVQQSRPVLFVLGKEGERKKPYLKFPSISGYL